MQIRLTLNDTLFQQVLARLQQAYRYGQLRVVKRIHAVLSLVEGKSVDEVARILALSTQSVRNYFHAFILDGLASFVYHKPAGCPPRLTKTQKQELGDLLDAGPEKAGYDCGCWNTVLIQDLILTRFGVEYTPHYVAQLLKTLGYSYQKARFVSDHLEDVAEERQTWLTQTWPALLKQAREQQALILFGDECSFAQWDSLSYTWARRGQQPEVRTSGRRRGYKVFGLIEYFSGAFYYRAQSDKFTGDSYIAFLTDVLARTQDKPLILLQDGARYHTSTAVKTFFQAHTDRLTVYQLPRYSPEFNPIEFLWRNVKKQATHLRYFPTFADLTAKVDSKLQHFADLPESIKGLLGRYCETLGETTA